MPGLRELQREWSRYLLNHETLPLRQAIAEPPTDNIDIRIGIYADAYEARLVEALEKNFPYLQQWLGDADFYALCEAYLAEFPSRYLSVRDFGQHFSTFLHKHSGKHVAELAALEWAVSLAIDLPDAPLLTKKGLEKIPAEAWGEVVFRLHPGLQILPFTSNIIDIYQALIRKQAVLPEPKMIANPPVYCRVWRKNLQVYYFVMDIREACFLRGIQEGKNFAEICEMLCETLPENEVAGIAIGQLLRWLDEGLLVDI